jgi:DNA end-binding protein Ku
MVGTRRRWHHHPHTPQQVPTAMATARSIGSLTISFGLVAIPVKLYSAGQSAASLSFNLLHKDCGSRLRQQYVCIKDGTVVDRDDMVKGYEFAKDQYVTFTPQEIKALEEAGSHAVEIAEFVPADAVDPVYFDKTYYLAPDKGAARPYALLTQALKESRRCAVGRWAARGHAYIVMLRPVGDVLAMQQLHFATEVRPASEIDVPRPDVKPAELALAQQLIGQQTSDTYDPSAYSDELRARIDAAIQKKVEGQEISVSEVAPERAGAQVIDLMEALRASLAKSGSAKEETSRLGPRKAPQRIAPARETPTREPAPKPARKAGKR